MIIVLLCILVAFFIFGCFMILKGCEIQKRNEEIYKLVLDLRDRLDLHNL